MTELLLPPSAAMVNTAPGTKHSCFQGPEAGSGDAKSFPQSVPSTAPCSAKYGTGVWAPRSTCCLMLSDKFWKVLPPSVL